MYTSNIVLHVPFLRYLAMRARVIVELGIETGNGSTRAFEEGFALNMEGIIWVGVDKDVPGRIPEDERFKFCRGDTTHIDTVRTVADVLAGGIRQNASADLIFIDTLHTPEQMRKELEIWPLLGGWNCTYVFHDTWMEGKYNPMTDVIKDWAQGQWLRFLDYSKENNGLGVVFR